MVPACLPACLHLLLATASMVRGTTLPRKCRPGICLVLLLTGQYAAAAQRGIVGCVGEAAGEHKGERRGERTPLASVTFLHQLNEVQDGLLLAGTADGALRVWRNYALKAEQRLATAWQVDGLLCCVSLAWVVYMDARMLCHVWSRGSQLVADIGVCRRMSLTYWP